MIGKALALKEKLPFKEKSSDAYGAALLTPIERKRRVNYVAVVISIFLPWFIFIFVFGCVSFSTHYTRPGLCWFAVTCSALVVSVCLCAAILDQRKRQEHKHHHEPTWFGFMLASSLIAWFAGVALGEHNFDVNLKPYYDMASLKSYPSVDPAELDSRAIADAGRVFFSHGSHLDLDRAANFRNMKTYCVAPVIASGKRLASYDFWAVGVDCCSNTPGSFVCGEAKNTKAAAGMRILDDELLPYYYLAVKQAQVRYNMTSKHPLFFTWMADPIANLNEYRDRGLREYLFWVFLFLGWSGVAASMKLMLFLRSVY
mmetsp:Transcript_66888/g.116374  ORF Transcript_66888/g.116374 Transcript_66888/m.116374 type:complete len:314 (-) Transcript_66888:62-1003(-)